MALFDVAVTQDEGKVVAVLSGEVDLSTVADVERRLDAALPGDAPLMVLDLRAVTFLDSSGLRLVLRTDKRQRSGGNRLVIVQGPRRVARLFEITGIGAEVEIVDDPADIST